MTDLLQEIETDLAADILDHPNLVVQISVHLFFNKVGPE